MTMLALTHRPLLAILVSLLAAGAILLCDRRPNLRETWSFLAAGIKILIVLSLLPQVLAHGSVGATYIELLPGLSLHLKADLFGLIFALLTAYFWKRMGKSRELRRGRNVLATLVAFTVIYGVLCGSYFGISPPAGSTLANLQILDAQSQAVMMPLTIVIGVIHLSLANVVTAWLNRGRATALASLGWVVVMAGATMAGIGAFGDIGTSTAEWLKDTGGLLLVGGLVAVFLFSSKRPLFSLSVKNHVLRAFDGLTGLTGLSGLFGDVLSYLRLFALGLSSAKLSETFNGLGASAWDEAGFGVIAAIAIVVVGHTLNILLGVMGGVVHGLRLNCIEFFKWCLPEEGYQFKAFEKKAKQT